MSGFSIEAFNFVDFIIIGIILLSVIISVIRGFVKELLSLITWVVAFWIAFRFGPSLAGVLSHYIASDNVRLILAYSVLFIGTLILGAIVNYTICQLVNKTGLSGTDRLIGVVFGLARGVLLIAVMGLLIQTFLAKNESPVWLTQSQLYPHFEPLVSWLHGKIPASINELGKYEPNLNNEPSHSNVPNEEPVPSQ